MSWKMTNVPWVSPEWLGLPAFFMNERKREHVQVFGWLCALCSISIKYICPNTSDLCRTKELFIPSVPASCVRKKSFFCPKKIK